MIITRERNIYKIYANENSRKPYIFDADTNRMYLTNGKRGVPNNSQMQCIYYLLIQSQGWQELCNRIISYPTSNDIKDEYYNFLISYWYRSREVFDTINSIKDFWREIFPYLKNGQSFSNYAQFLKMKTHSLIKKYFDNEELIQFISNELYFQTSSFDTFVKQFSVKAFREDIKHFYKIYLEVKKTILNLNEIHSPVIQVYSLDSLKSRLDNWFGSKIRDSQNTIFAIFHFIEKLELTNYKITNLKRDYEKLSAMWDEKKYIIENRCFKAKQIEKNLFFENDEYKIFIPTSREELQEIGDYFNNCANGIEWERYLSDGKRYLVIVKEKSTNKWRVCCDIDMNMRICQYLTINNSTNIPENAEVFKNLYQEYLKTL